MPKTPSYRKRAGYEQALVTLTDSVTKKRRDYWLGPHGSNESREMYHRIIAEWEANGRRLPRMETVAEPEVDGCVDESGGILMVTLLADFFNWAKVHYDPGELRSCSIVMALMRRYFGRTPAAKFGPKKLRLLRDEMIRGDTTCKPPRKPWSRKYINQQVQRIRRIIKWAVSHELIGAEVHQALCTVEPLKRGRSAAKENPKITGVPEHILKKVLPKLNKQVRALVDLQLLTGARAGELVSLRRCDIEVDDKTGVWRYRPDKHKNAYRERERIIYFGPAAQRVLLPFMGDRPTTACLFQPSDAEKERRELLTENRETPPSCGNTVGSNRKKSPKISPGERYTTDSYRRAIWYACDHAFPPPPPLARRKNETVNEWRERLTKGKLLPKLNTWRKEHRFSPHQLRHSAGTRIRTKFGLEAAQLALGHASANITDAIYAERDQTKVIEIMKNIG